MKKYNVAVLGATGAVGREMIRALEERAFPVERLLPLASARSAGKKISFRGAEAEVREAQPDAFAGMDIVLGAVDSARARELAPHITAAGAVFIDNSSAFRMEPEVPLVVPEINGADALAHKGIIAKPNCSTIIAMVALAPIAELSPIKTVVASTYQAVSGAGQEGLTELEEQLSALAKGEPAPAGKVFPCRIAGNVVPYIGKYKENMFTDEEMKMQNEGRRILHLPDLRVSCTCVRVPVMRSHSISLSVVTERDVSPEEAMEAISRGAGCAVAPFDGRDFPTPLDSSEQDLVMVGRVRRGLCHENELCLWCCGDQLRKGAAVNAVQIAEILARA